MPHARLVPGTTGLARSLPPLRLAAGHDATDSASSESVKLVQWIALGDGIMCTLIAGNNLTHVRRLTDVSEQAQQLLTNHPQFRGRASAFEFVKRDRVLQVHGQVPSFYLKQLLQSVLRELEGLGSIDDRVDVVSVDGLSSVRRQ